MRIGITEPDYNIGIICTIAQNEFVLIPKSVKLLFDTGSDITIIKASDLGINITEKQFLTRIQQINNIHIIKAGHLKENGIIVANMKGISTDGKTIKAYALQVDSFDIHTIDGILHLKSVPIFISFSTTLRRSLLGRDLLHMFDMSILHSKRLLDLRFNKTDDTIDPIYMLKEGLYSKEHMLINALEKNDIHNAFTKALNSLKGE